MAKRGDDGKDPERRRRQAHERLGTTTPRCGECGEADWRCLEAHHVAGRRFDEATVILCRNCHRKASDAQKDHPEAVADDPSWLERIGHFLLGLADLLALAVEKLKLFGQELIDRAFGLRESGP